MVKENRDLLPYRLFNVLHYFELWYRYGLDLLLLHSDACPAVVEKIRT